MKRRTALLLVAAAAGLPLMVACGTSMNAMNEHARAKTVTDTAYPVQTQRHGNTASLMLVRAAR